MNEVANVKATGLAALKALKTGLRNVSQKLPDATGQQYLRMGKDGTFVFGKDDNVVASGTEAIINIMSLQHGYTAWTNKQPGQGKNELRGEIMRPISTELPHVSALEQYTDAEWKDQVQADLKFLDGKHKGTQVTYKGSSRGALSAMREVIDAAADALDRDDEYCFPVVSVGSDSYKHTTYGKTFVPKFGIIGWANMVGEVIYDDDDDEADGAPAEIAPPAPEPEAVEGRRRRRV